MTNKDQRAKTKDYKKANSKDSTGGERIRGGKKTGRREKIGDTASLVRKLEEIGRQGGDKRNRRGSTSGKRIKKGKKTREGRRNRKTSASYGRFGGDGRNGGGNANNSFFIVLI